MDLSFFRTAYLDHKKAIQVIEELIEMVQLAGTTKLEIIQALKNSFKDFEDLIQYSTALTIDGIEAIITRNVRDYEKSEIAVFTPENFLKSKFNES